MEYKIFLSKYRVPADEIAIATTEPSGTGGTALATEPQTATRAYRGVEIDSGREVTVEVIPALGFKNAAREELEAEATTAQKINHPNIPTLYDFGIEDDQLIYVTEFTEGTTAEDWIKTKGPMSASGALRIAP